MEIISFKNAYHRFTKTTLLYISEVKIIDLNQVIDVLINEYENIQIGNIDQENPDKDMLLFEYGNYDWDGNGLKFEISLKRQIFLKNIDECGYYGWRIFFKTKNIGEINNYSKWCFNKNELANWKSIIKSTKGFVKASEIKYETIEFELIKPT